MGYLYVLAAAVLWGLLGPVSRFAMRDGVDPLEIAFWRALIAGACFGVHAVAIGRTRMERRDLPAAVGFGLVGVALFFAAYFNAVRSGGAALASVLLYTAPVWVALLSAVFLRERMNRRTLLAVTLAIAGVAGIALAGGGSVRLTPAALSWGLLSGWAYATYYLVGKRYFTRYHAATFFLYALPVGALALLPFVRFGHKTATAWAVLVFLAVVPTYGSFLLYGAGLRTVDATRASTVATLEPVVAAVAAFAVWGERMGAGGYLFALLVVAAVVLMVTGERTDPSSPGPFSRTAGEGENGNSNSNGNGNRNHITPNRSRLTSPAVWERSKKGDSAV
ncbi:MAG TPA: EamA family transporter [Longimicrobium sp.]|nr:EamA family transporter [Longimicrobium sp.]